MGLNLEYRILKDHTDKFERLSDGTNNMRFYKDPVDTIRYDPLDT